MWWGTVDGNLWHRKHRGGAIIDELWQLVLLHSNSFWTLFLPQPPCSLSAVRPACPCSDNYHYSRLDRPFGSALMTQHLSAFWPNKNPKLTFPPLCLHWGSLVPCSASTAAHILIIEWFYKFGVLNWFQSNQGRSFESSPIHQLCCVSKIAQSRTPVPPWR